MPQFFRFDYWNLICFCVPIKCVPIFLHLVIQQVFTYFYRYYSQPRAKIKVPIVRLLHVR